MPPEPTVTSLPAQRCVQRWHDTVAPLVDDLVAMRTLVAAVDAKVATDGPVHDADGRLSIDIACAVVEARVEELEEQHGRDVVWLPEPAAAERLRSVLTVLVCFLSGEPVPDSVPGMPAAAGVLAAPADLWALGLTGTDD